MGVVDVDGHIAVEFIDTFVVFLLIMADDALEAGRYEEVFLHQAQAAAVFIAVVRIEETGNLLDAVLIAEGRAGRRWTVPDRAVPANILPATGAAY